jgi:hypothetical protein
MHLQYASASFMALLFLHDLRIPQLLLCTETRYAMHSTSTHLAESCCACCYDMLKCMLSCTAATYVQQSTKYTILHCVQDCQLLTAQRCNDIIRTFPG